MMEEYSSLKKSKEVERIFCGSTSGIFSLQSNIKRDNKSKLTFDDENVLQWEIEGIRKRLDEAIKFKESEVFNENAMGRADFNKSYEMYKTNSPSPLLLPIHSSKQSILNKIEDYSSIIIVGNTGCGKSTQVPQIILDDAYSQGRACNIIITQPRRIAAQSIARQVSFERGWELGSVVGYQIGLDKRFMSDQTRITYCTTGVLLEKLIKAKTSINYTHIILDEVHERDKDMDFLFIIIRMLMGKNGFNVKIILMSATINTLKFAAYFKCYKEGEWVPAPIIHIDKKNKHSVKTFFLEEFIGTEHHILNLKWEKPGIPEPLLKFTLGLISSLHSADENENCLPSILVFLPGIYEIGRLHTILFSESLKSNRFWKIFILHSLISSQDQQKIFQPVEKGFRKIILSTNIAESSITVPDVKYVIDFCLTKHLKTDVARNFTTLELSWASKDKCKQRSGRAGRISDGKCYRMVPKGIYDYYIEEFATPELLLTPLENVILKAKQFKEFSPHIVLGLAMDPPKLKDLATTIMNLKLLGALLQTTGDDGFSKVDGDMTFMGTIMAELPIDVQASRLIALGYCFSVLEESIIMAATLTVKSIFKLNFEKSLNPYSRRLEWSNGSGSDLFAAYNAYQIWTIKYNQQKFGKHPEQRKAESQFCFKHNLDVRSLHECFQVVQELTKRCEKLGMRIHGAGVGHIHLNEQEKAIILKIVISGAFYPNFLATCTSNSLMAERDLFSELNGRDPNKTVYFSGFRLDHIRELYVKSIKNVFRNTIVKEENLHLVRVSFDKNSEKVFVTFDTEVECAGENRKKICSIPGRILPEVYMAIKMRQLKIIAKIPVMNQRNEKRIAVKCGIGYLNGAHFIYNDKKQDDIRYLCIPNATVSELDGVITHIENCSKFWFQPQTEKENVQRYIEMLNVRDCSFIEKIFDDEIIDKATTIVARNENDGNLHRARLLNCGLRVRSSAQCTVLFIDFGYTQKCELNELYTFKEKNNVASMPPRCFECCLAEVQPSTANLNGGNTWDHKAIELFKLHTLENHVKAKIYSIVNGIVNVSIIEQSTGFNITQSLIEQKLGEYCEENYLSKENHLKRKLAQEYLEILDANDNKNSAIMNRDSNEYYPIAEADAIEYSEELDKQDIILVGPKSPLETSMFSVLDYGNSKPVHIDPQSLNSVLLSSIRQHSHIRYMVAANICQRGVENASLLAYETTLLPNIRGFGPLVAMIFCPMADLKRDSMKSRYVSLLTGLGPSGRRGTPLFPERDAVFQLDFELKNNDIQSINEVRFSLSSLLLNLQDQYENGVSHDEDRIHLMSKLKTVTLGLVLKNRKPMGTLIDTHEWNSKLSGEFEAPIDSTNGNAIFPLHGIWELHPIDEETKQRLRRHCIDLQDMTSNFRRQVTCKLCEKEIENVTDLRMHLLSQLHIEREMEIDYVKSEN